MLSGPTCSRPAIGTVATVMLSSPHAHVVSSVPVGKNDALAGSEMAAAAASDNNNFISWFPIVIDEL
jgi:hypothetical protein